MEKQNPIQSLIRNLSRLPGIGEKTATRLALYIMNSPKEEALALGQSIIEVRQKIHLCQRCFNYTDSDLCFICSHQKRNTGYLCVVETPADLMSIERTGEYKGRYYVLHGAISPLEGKGPEQLRIPQLLQTVSQQNIQEVILATNPTINGNATAIYISGQLASAGVRITRIAQGIPSGSDIEYADQVTLKNAMDGRREMK